MLKVINIVLLLLTCLGTVTIPQLHLDYEVFYLNFLGLGYLGFYIFFISNKSLFDLIATAFLLFIGLMFDSILSNYGLYFYGLIDFPYFTPPPSWSAVLWLIVPLQFYKMNLKFKFLPAALLHVLGIVFFERLDLMFIEQPYEYNLVSTLIMWIILYRVIFKILEEIEARFFRPLK